jgi:hypothetical protein
MARQRSFTSEGKTDVKLSFQFETVEDIPKRKSRGKLPHTQEGKLAYAVAYQALESYPKAKRIPYASLGVRKDVLAAAFSRVAKSAAIPGKQHLQDDESEGYAIAYFANLSNEERKKAMEYVAEVLRKIEAKAKAKA